MSPGSNNRKPEEILDSLDGIRRAQAPAFFYTRLRARMDNDLEYAGGGFIGRLLTRPALAISMAAVILLLNITTITKMWQQDNAPAPDNTQQLAADYALNTYAVYDENAAE